MKPSDVPQLFDNAGQIASLERQIEHLKGGGGGGTFGGMEARVARLESDMEHVKKAVDRVDGKLDSLIASVGAVASTIATLDERTRDSSSSKTALTNVGAKVDVIEERTKHLPTKPYIWVCLGAVATVSIGVISGVMKLLS
ncbi:hypothetical protein [Sphingomonas sp. 3-13AW]|uniref:hypothetical protein n=1 Tax=Sphingomonas sp. 3-13AW TaxID=3050450 RepID=UPI003BB5151F